MASLTYFKIHVIIIMTIFTNLSFCQKQCDLKYELSSTRLINHYHESVSIKSLEDCELFCLKDPKCDAIGWKVSKASNVSKYDDIRCFLYKEGELSFTSDDVEKYTAKVCKVPSLVSMGKPSVSSVQESVKRIVSNGHYDFNPNDRDKRCARDMEYWQVDLLTEYKILSLHIWGTVSAKWSLRNLIAETSLTATGADFQEFGRVTEDSQYRYDFGKRIYVVKSKDQQGTHGKLVHLQMEHEKTLFSMCVVEVYGYLEKLNEGLVQLNHTEEHVLSSNIDGVLSNVSLAYDGNTDQLDVKKCFSSTRGASGISPFWRIDLPSHYRIMMVRVYNQGKCCGHQFTSIVVAVRLEATIDWKDCAKFSGAGATLRIYDFGCNSEEGVSASTVKVAIDSKKKSDQLVICEVEIFVTAE